MREQKKLEEYNCYEYFDTPEGQDINKKIWWTSKFAIPAGLGLSIADILLNSHPKTSSETFGRFSYVFFPAVAIPVVFVAVTNQCAVARRKNDYLNWVAGGVAVSSLTTLCWRRKMAFFIPFTAICAFMAVNAKYITDNDILSLPKKHRHQLGGVGQVRHDFTLTKYRPGNYEVKSLSNKKKVKIAEKYKTWQDIP